MTLDEQIFEVRSDPRLWLECFGYARDEETRQPIRGKTNVLQRRIFAYYAECQREKKPFRACVLKYRRARSSTAASALMYMHAQNYSARLGVIGMDYKASSNMISMVEFFGDHDEFPGWHDRPKVAGVSDVPPEEWDASTPMEILSFEERINRKIATKIDFGHDSVLELYTAVRPVSARSAGLNGYHATEVAFWPNGGAQDGGETMKSMRNTLPKKGFHVAIEESTANGCQGVFYETCCSARWPENAEWAKQWEHTWPLKASEYGKDLQFVFIFAGWHEDDRHVESITPEQEQSIKDSLDEEEKRLIARYGNEGPKGLRLGQEVNATAWEQLAWRRGMISNVCTQGGVLQFDQEFPDSPATGFRSTGRPALDPEGVMVLETLARTTLPDYGILSQQRDGQVIWTRVPKDQAIFMRWEEPIESDQGAARYILSCDPMSGAEKVLGGGRGSGELDNHAVFVLRDAYTDHRGVYHQVKAVARIAHPCQWESEVLTKQIYLLSLYYGGATIVVEANIGAPILKSLSTDYDANVYQREEFNKVTQRTTKQLGWLTTEPSRRILIATLQNYVREQMLDLRCPVAVSEMSTLIINEKGKAEASGKNKDDSVLALGIGLECLPAAHAYPRQGVVRPLDPNAGSYGVPRRL